MGDKQRTVAGNWEVPLSSFRYLDSLCCPLHDSQNAMWISTQLTDKVVWNMSDKPQYLTREGKMKLEAELEYLITTERKLVAERINAAKELGDISESGEYEDAKKAQALLEGRVNEIKTILSKAQLIDDDQNGVKEVRIGSSVTVRVDGEDEDETWFIVGSAEASPREGKISNESPIGAALLGKKPRQKVTVQTPDGVMKLTIVRVN
jgi:transcription elongation factor GreA